MKGRGKNVGKKLEKKIRKLTPAEKLAVLAIAIAMMLVFSHTALSDLANHVKAPLLILELVLTGLAVQHVTGLEGWGGLLLVRAKHGFKFVNNLAKKIALPAKEASELGLSLGFGTLYALYAFRENKKKLFIHFAAILAFFLFVTIGGEQGRHVVLLAGFLFGLAGLGVFSLATHALNILTIPSAPPGVYPIVPGLTPGIPLVEGIIALVVIVVVHELAHGVLCRAEGLALKSGGMILFGFLPIGAFVEPDEKRFKRLALEKKRRIFSAGSTSNLVFFFVFLALSLAPMAFYPSTVEAVAINKTISGLPAEGKLFPGDVVLVADGVEVKNSGELGRLLKAKKGGEAIELIVESRTFQGCRARNVTIVVGKDGKIGIVAEDMPKKGFEAAFAATVFVYRVFYLTYTLNFALALVNLLPLFVTDGHRILQDELTARLGKRRERFSKKIVAAMGVVCLILIILNAVPWFK